MTLKMLNDTIVLFKIFTIYSKAQVFVYMFNLSYRSCAILLLFLTFVFKSKVVVNIMSHRQLQIRLNESEMDLVIYDSLTSIILHICHQYCFVLTVHSTYANI